MEEIVAISTAKGTGGIGIIRISGKNTFKIIEKIFVPKNKEEIKGYTIKYGHIIGENNEIIDEVLVSYFFAPKSYTTENMCEINSHGNSVVLKRILDLCIKNGARMAEPGEFTKRAFINGRIDLSQAEAVIDLINSKNEVEQKVAMNHLKGTLSKNLKEIKEDLLEILSNIEVSIDYPEYDVEEVSYIDLIKNTKTVKEKLKEIEESFEKGKLIREGVSVAIVGSPNAGKSSLLNALLNEERAIVTEIAGTTRDTVEEFLNIKGTTFRIIDTAGIRKTKDTIEKIGIEKSKKAIDEADLIIMIIDSTKDISEEEIEILEEIKEKEAIIILNKIDLKGKVKENIKKIEKYGKDIVEISALKKEGIENLFDKLLEKYDKSNINTDNSEIITNIRHKNLISDAIKELQKITEEENKKMPIDIYAIYIKEAIEKLNEITGQNVTEDLINKIFSRFCLGK